MRRAGHPTLASLADARLVCLVMAVACRHDDPRPVDPTDTATPTPCRDLDADGACADVDCDDDDPAVHPGAPDVLGDGVDQDCDGGDGDLVLELGEPSWVPPFAGGESGRALVAGPDVDGDGLADVIVGTASVLGDGVVDASRDGLVTVLDGTGIELGSRTGPVGRGTSTGAALAVGADLDGDGAGPDVAIWSQGDEGEGRVTVATALALAGDGMVDEVDGDVVIGTYDVSGILSSMRIAPDLTGDGTADLVVATARADIASVRIFAGPLADEQPADAATVVLQAEPLTAVGTAFALSDFDADGVADLGVSAAQADGNLGHIYLLPGPLASGRLEDAPVVWQGQQPEAQTGSDLAAVGDLDGDGTDDALIGAALDGRDGDRAGRAFLLPGDAPSGTIDDLAIATFVADRAHRFVGYAVAAGGDIDGDSQPDLLVGAPNDWYFPDGPGEVWVYPGPVAGTLRREDAWRVLQGAQFADVAGFGIAAADLDGDGRSDVVVGAPGDDDLGANAGRVYLVTAAALDP